MCIFKINVLRTGYFMVWPLSTLCKMHRIQLLNKEHKYKVNFAIHLFNVVPSA